ncbi:hypothetical protein GCM10011396_23880 [Undibacterium terreum]|uniref:Uncharacterized protein n=1 Tax=Undibacterium terreum TaxID=1224302 RepID=A0A916ULC0_9BURK|nr:hypothetical protein GCM10011396_23880 [Undibacterium terreum]
MNVVITCILIAVLASGRKYCWSQFRMAVSSSRSVLFPSVLISWFQVPQRHVAYSQNKKEIS